MIQIVAMKKEMFSGFPAKSHRELHLEQGAPVPAERDRARLRPTVCLRRQQHSKQSPS